MVPTYAHSKVLVIFNIFILTNSAEIIVKAETQIEPVFTEVIKNISRVNVLLQDLIKNYEKMQKMSQPKQSIDDYISDTDDASYNATENKSKQFTSNGQPTEKIHKQYATAMIISDNEPESVTLILKKPQNQVNENVTKFNFNGNVAERESIFDNILRPQRQPNIEALQAVSQYEITSSSETSLDSNDDGDFSSNKTGLMLSESPLIKDYKREMKTDSNKEERNDKPQFRNVILDGHASNVDTGDNEEPRPLNNNGLLIYVPKSGKSFSREDVAKKTTLVIFTNKKQTESVLDSTESDSGVNDSVSMQKELFKTKVLRQAYGDACMQVHLRKCYKATKAVAKQSCSNHRCPAGLKSLYKKNGKIGCNKQFYNTSKSQDERKKRERQFYSPHNRAETDIVEDPFVDMTRDGFIAGSCFPHLKPQIKPTKDGEESTAREIDPSIQQVNILRDKYERACQKESRKKCISSCKYAAKTTCKKKPCSKQLTKTLKRVAKKHCKTNYKIDKESSSSNSESDESSDSSSNEEESDHVRRL